MYRLLVHYWSDRRSMGTVSATCQLFHRWLHAVQFSYLSHWWDFTVQLSITKSHSSFTWSSCSASSLFNLPSHALVLPSIRHSKEYSPKKGGTLSAMRLNLKFKQHSTAADSTQRLLTIIRHAMLLTRFAAPLDQLQAAPVLLACLSSKIILTTHSSSQVLLDCSSVSLR